jgi:hypothetical protein
MSRLIARFSFFFKNSSDPRIIKRPPPDRYTTGLASMLTFICSSIKRAVSISRLAAAIASA